MDPLVISIEAPTADDVRVLLDHHLSFANEVTPAGHVHALDLDGLGDASVTFFTARIRGGLVGVGALRYLDHSHAELKSMHTSTDHRGRGVGRAIAEQLLETAADRGHDRVSLETGTMDAFGPARALYASLGFEECPPFGDYTRNPHSVCMTVSIRGRRPPRGAVRRA